MDVREKLVELFQQDDCPLFMVFGDNVDVLADYLIANGLTINQWFSASEPPKENGYYLCVILFSAVGNKKEYRRKILF